jgi:hypothetical protein
MPKIVKKKTLERKDPIKEMSSTTSASKGPKLNKVLGQHLLKNPGVVTSIVDKVSNILF